MAFIPRLSWGRSKPPIYVVDGAFEVMAEYFHHPKLVNTAREHCKKLNSRIRIKEPRP